MMRRCVLLLAVTALGLADKDAPGAKDREAMQGEWACESLTRDGTALDPDNAQALFRSVKGDKYVITRFRSKAGSGTFTLDATKTPREIDLVPDGPKKVVIKGIYMLDAEGLTMCYSAAGVERP